MKHEIKISLSRKIFILLISVLLIFLFFGFFNRTFAFSLFDIGKGLSRFLSSVFLTTTGNNPELEILYPGTYQTQVNPGQTLSTTVFLKNKSSEEYVKLTQIVLGNQQNNNFLSYIEENSYLVQYTDSKGIHTFVLTDSGQNATNGYRIFNISSPLSLPPNSTKQYQVSAKFKNILPLKELIIELTDIYGSGATTGKPIKSQGSLSIKINISQPTPICQTPTYQCSVDQTKVLKVCEDGTTSIFQDCTAENKVCSQNQCIDKICSDGTLYNQCSQTKPKYCKDGTLINNCQLCGCPSDSICQTNGTCQTPVTCTDSDEGKNLYIKGTTKWGPISGKYYEATDGCDYTGKTLSENYCYYSENLKGYYSTVEYHVCPYGCKDGACAAPPLAKNCGVIHEGTKDYSKAINFVIVPADSLYGNLLNDPNAQYSNNLNAFITDANKIVNDFLSINPINGYKNIFNFYYDSAKVIKCTLPGDYVMCDLWKEAADDCSIPYDEVIILQRTPRGGLYGGPWILSSLSFSDFTHEIGHFFGLRDVDNLDLPVGPNHCTNLNCCGGVVCQVQNWCSFERIELGGPNCCFYLGTTQNTSFYIPNEQTVYNTCAEIEEGLKFNHFNHLEIKYLNELFATISSLGKENVRCGSSFMTTKYCPAPLITCTDSDRGKDFYVKGKTTGHPKMRIDQPIGYETGKYSTYGTNDYVTLEDYCYKSYDSVTGKYGSRVAVEKGEWLREYFCDTDNKITFYAQKCENGCQDGVCVEKPKTCTDGTLYGQCSINKPKYCDNGILVDKCSICGCPLNYNCNIISGSCEQKETTEEYCLYPLCDTTSKTYDLTASNNPQDYLGERIAFESYSNWKNYQPLKNKVNELIQKKTTDYDKLVAMATWVKHSKTYGEPSPANEFKTVIDIFNSNTGICLDASILLTAMLRLAEIPVRSVTHAFAFHNFNEVYVDGNWIQVDATFGEGNLFIQDMSKSPILVDPSFIFEYYNHFNNIEDKLRGVTYSDIYFYKRKFIESDVAKSQGIKYGKLIFPSNAKTLFYDENQNKVIGVEREGGLEPTWIMHRFEVMDNKCLEKVNIADFRGLSALEFYYWAFDSTGETWTGAPRITGYRIAKIPACKYRIHYYYSMTGLNYAENQLAYADFEIKIENQIVEIKPDSLIKVPGGDQNNFNILINTLSQITCTDSTERPPEIETKIKELKAKIAELQQKIIQLLAQLIELLKQK